MKSSTKFEITVDQLYEEDENLRKEDVIIFQKWLSKQQHLPILGDFSERVVIKFIQGANYRLEEAKINFDNYFTQRTLYFSDFSSLSEDDLKIYSSLAFVNVLPVSTPEKYLVCIIKLLDSNTKNFDFVKLLKYAITVITLRLFQAGCIWGSIAVFDLKEFTLNHLAKIDMIALKRAAQFVQEAAPIRLKAIHVINLKFVDKFKVFLKPFLSVELYNMLNFHSTSNTLYAEIPQKILPKEYGGELSSCRQLSDDYLKIILEHGELVKWHDTLLVDESKRLEKLQTGDGIFGVDGTFRKLAID